MEISVEMILKYIWVYCESLSVFSGSKAIELLSTYKEDKNEHFSLKLI